MLLRRVIGNALRARRQGQHRTLREISTAANVSLGYLSEIERGQKEASSELLAAICEALGSQLSEVLREASDSLARAERPDMVRTGVPDGTVPVPVPEQPVPVPEQARPAEPARSEASAGAPGRRVLPAAPAPREVRTVIDGEVSVSVRRHSPLRTSLHTLRPKRTSKRPC